MNKKKINVKEVNTPLYKHNNRNVTYTNDIKPILFILHYGWYVIIKQEIILTNLHITSTQNITRKQREPSIKLILI